MWTGLGVRSSIPRISEQRRGLEGDDWKVTQATATIETWFLVCVTMNRAHPAEDQLDQSPGSRAPGRFRLQGATSWDPLELVEEIANGHLATRAIVTYMAFGKT
jgi:hypothetical protein